MSADIRAWIDENQDKFMEGFLFEWLKIPSISADPAHERDSERACELLQDELIDLGFKVEQIELKDRHDAVYAELIIDESLPTVLIYGHYDVQPPNEDKENKWTTPPFQPEVRDGRIYAQGTADDKGQIAAHLLAMRYLRDNDNHPCNFRFIIEGDEEGSGSGVLEEYIRANPKKFACDAVVISDTEKLREDVPSLTTRLRGIVVADVSTENVHDLTYLIHNLHDQRRNKVRVDGFYDDVVENIASPEAEELDGKAEEVMGPVVHPEEGYTVLTHRTLRPTNTPIFLGYANTDVEEDAEGTKTFRIVGKGPLKPLHSGEVGGPVSEPALNLAHALDRLTTLGITYEIDCMHYSSREPITTTIQTQGYAQITIDVEEAHLFREIVGEYFHADLIDVEEVEDRTAYLQSDDFKTEGGEFDPRFEKPTAFLSFRTVEGQDPEKVYRAVEKTARRFVSEVEVSKMKTGPAYIADLEGPFYRAAVEGLKTAHETDDLDEAACGGSIPIVECLSEVTESPVILAGLCTRKSNIHGVDESMAEEEFRIGTEAAVQMYNCMGKVKIER